MADKLIATYGLCDDLGPAIQTPGEPRHKRPDVEGMTTALVAALCFRGNLARARLMLKTYGDIPAMRSKRRFSRRRHGRREPLLARLHL
jgi:hypothetical protein